MSNPIEWVVFDLGGVLIKLDNLSFERAFKNLVGLPRPQIQQQITDLWCGFSIGRYNTTQMAEQLSVLCERSISTQAFEAVLRTQLVGVDPQMLELVRKLSSDSESPWPVACFSNTNHYHWQILCEEYRCLDLFVMRMASHLEGLAKPDPAAFMRIAERLKTSVESCIYIDDLVENIRGAAKAGMTALHFQGIDQLKRALTQRAIIF